MRGVLLADKKIPQGEVICRCEMLYHRYGSCHLVMRLQDYDNAAEKVSTAVRKRHVQLLRAAFGKRGHVSSLLYLQDPTLRIFGSSSKPCLGGCICQAHSKHGARTVYCCVGNVQTDGIQLTFDSSRM